MIISKCPLRISLVGGATDLQLYLDKYKKGSVISFPSNLYTYIILNTIKSSSTYRIVYSKIEHVNSSHPEEIKNDIVRVVFTHFNVPPVEVIFTSDIPSSGSGLGASSSYLVGLISAVTKLLCIELSQYEICELAIKLERKYNPLTGYQDAYGCGIGALKLMTFSPDGLETIKFLNASVFRKMTVYLCPTNQLRSSTSVLNTLDVDKIDALKYGVEYLKRFHEDPYSIYYAVNHSWIKKKQTSPEIVNPEIEALEKKLRDEGAKAVKLLGAGGGGYFLVLTDCQKNKPDWIEISIDYSGVSTIVI